MPAATGPAAPDVLVSGARDPVPGRARPVAVGALLAVLTAVAVAGAALGARAGSGPTTTDLTGELELELLSVADQATARSDQREERAGVLTGQIHLDLPDRVVTGQIRLSAAASLLPTPTGPVLLHSWGTAEADLLRTHCRGSFGWSYYYDPPEAGGSLALRCDDGSVLGARVRVDSWHVPSGARQHWEFTALLEDGFYVPSS